jgi:hypothetical protein
MPDDEHIDGTQGLKNLIGAPLPHPPPRPAAAALSAWRLLSLLLRQLNYSVRPRYLPACLSAEQQGGSLTSDIAAADYCVLQHRKQPEHQEACHLFKRCVNIAWVLAAVMLGSLPSSTGGSSSSSSRYRPFPMAAIASSSTQRACISGFTGNERAVVTLMLRCTGAKVGAGVQGGLCGKQAG